MSGLPGMHKFVENLKIYLLTVFRIVKNILEWKTNQLETKK